MNRRSLMTLGLAVGCGLVAMYGASQLSAKKDKPVDLRDVLVAARDLKVEEVLKADLLKVVKLPADTVPPGAFSNADDVDGRWVQITTLEGEPIVAAKLAPKNLPPGLISRIPKGKRAFAIEVNEQTGVSGFILPDHRVDVLQTPRDTSRPGASSAARTILQNMLVLSVGQVVTRPEDKSLLVRTVTLAVTPEEAETLTAARTLGPLALALRGLNDDEIVKTGPVEPPLEPEKPEPAPAPPMLVQHLPVEPVPPVLERRPVVLIHGVRRVETLKVPTGKYVVMANPRDDLPSASETSNTASAPNATSASRPPAEDRALAGTTPAG